MIEFYKKKKKKIVLPFMTRACVCVCVSKPFSCSAEPMTPEDQKCVFVCVSECVWQVVVLMALQNLCIIHYSLSVSHDSKRRTNKSINLQEYSGFNISSTCAIMLIISTFTFNHLADAFTKW